MSNNRILNIPSTASSKQSSLQSCKNIEHSPTMYQLILSQFCKNQKVDKYQKSVPYLQSDKSLIQNLQQQIIELTNKVDYLTKENKILKQNRVNSLDIIQYKYLQMNNYSKLLEQLQQFKLENLSLKQSLFQLKIDFQISINPLKQIINHYITVPQHDIKDVFELRLSQLEEQISLQKSKCELLNLERNQLLEQNNYLENELHQCKQKLEYKIKQ
ncbi:unnamed protein product [Paramecium primaurelia]|uniref:Uncharacterized protein n=1 Tax=Paramecium primaurelia TaxID=5886 RepID=A0A8S1P1S6_PARPR|nr:unnamed protein product [Paramecium primaurelia]